MPYNTRRKSLSLPSLGIQLPNASRSHRPSTTKSSPVAESPQQPPQTQQQARLRLQQQEQEQQQQQQPPTKKVKRSHPSTSSSPVSPPRPRSSTATSIAKAVSFAERPKSSGRAAYEDTPPPSPGPTTDCKIDTEGISDVIVVGVIEQLEKTGNRPHLIKELATVLSSVSDAVSGYAHRPPRPPASSVLMMSSSANPGALLSSRLSAYMKRPGWTALSPCPLEKELTTVHPRKVYFFLTTRPRQEIPVDSSDIFAGPDAGGKGGKRIISPSVSSASVDEDAEAAEDRKREALSPSPEVDLSAQYLESGPGPDVAYHHSPTPADSFSGRSSLARDGSHGGSSSDSVLSHNHRAASPPLEGDEKEFTQTASSMRLRGMSLDELTVRPSTESMVDPQMEESEEERAKRNREAAEALFGAHHPHTMGLPMMSSPLVKPMVHVLEKEIKREGADMEMYESVSILGDSGMGLTWDTREVEEIRIEDLDDLFGAY